VELDLSRREVAGENDCRTSWVPPICIALGEKSAINGDTAMPGVVIAPALFDAAITG
jgi:hypothetical protein